MTRYWAKDIKCKYWGKPFSILLYTWRSLQMFWWQSTFIAAISSLVQNKFTLLLTSRCCQPYSWQVLAKLPLIHYLDGHLNPSKKVGGELYLESERCSLVQCHMIFRNEVVSIMIRKERVYKLTVEKNFGNTSNSLIPWGPETLA